MNMEEKILILNIDDILPNRFQPRIKFSEQAINELAESIKLHGVIQPIVVRKISDKYEIIAGERRYKASVLAGKTTIPAIVTSLDDKDSAEIALIENVQRQDLTPIEEAISYKKILDMGYISQGELGAKLGKTQSTIANKLRLLNLNDEVQESLMENKISERHARSLLKLDSKKQTLMLNRIINERLTVRKADEEIEKLLNNSSSDNTGNQKIIEETKGDQNMNNDILKEFNIPTEPIVEENNDEILFEEPTFSSKPDTSTINPIPMNSNPQVESLDNSFVQPVSPQQSVENSDNQQSVENIVSDVVMPEMEPQSVTNPGFMDIDKIASEAQDIVKNPEPLPDMDKLLKPDEDIKPIMEQVEQPLPVEPTNQEVNQPTGGKFFNMFNFNEPDNNEEFVDDVENKQVNMNFEEPLYSANNNIFTNVNMQQNDQASEESSISPVFPQQTVENINIEPQTDEIEQLPVEPIKDDTLSFGQPVNAFKLTDDETFTKPESSNYNESISRPYMMNNDITFDEEGEIKVNVPDPNVHAVSVDMKTVINTIRNCAKQIEQYGYKIDTDEIDLADAYEVTFKIEKN